MSTKIKLTRPELKRQRDALRRFERYLPMLKLKQQQLQMMVRQMLVKVDKAFKAIEDARKKFEPFKALADETAGVDMKTLAEPSEVKVRVDNIAGVNVPFYIDAEFPPVTYSLFATPAWVDETLKSMRSISSRQAEYETCQKGLDLLDAELTKIVQRVNLFEKVKIPDAKDVIRRIRIRLGDEMTAAVGRGKITKGKITASEATIYPHEKADNDSPRGEAV